MAKLNKVILSYPTTLSLADGAPSSWIQLARTGKFVSSRYGKFEISKDDLEQMLFNFKNITPKAPTELPVDFDHLSMDPKRPGDGAASGWMKELELREDGTQLWAKVAWTPEGADHIKNGSYRFISPSFVKDHTHKDGKKIGTTLLAAAVTNHPFLEGMAALTLHDEAAMGALATFNLSATVADEHVARVVLHLAEAGQRVMIAPGNARTQDEVGGTFEIAEVVGEGDDAFVSVKDANGLVHKWFRATELLPASSTPANPVANPLQPGVAPTVPAQMPGVPTQPVSQATNPQQVANAAAQAQAAAAAAAAGIPPGTPGAPPVPGAEPGAAPGTPPVPGAPNANSAANAPGADAKALPAGAQKEGESAKSAKVAEGAVGVAAKKPQADEDEDPMKQALKKAVAGLFSDTAQKGTDMTFTLRNDKNEEVVVSLAQLEAAGIKVVPEGATAVPNTELDSMKGQITNLSTTVDSLKADNEAAAKKARVFELNTELDRLTKNALISRTTRDALFNQFKDATDLSNFKALAATFTKSIVELNTEHGTGNEGDADQGAVAQKELINLANTLAKEKGISLSDAVKLAGSQLADRAEQYRESFADVTH